MTIVGYNDYIWCDINQNGFVDTGERGALKIANSWGSDWGNGGFVWVAYDALRATSAVPGGPQDREKAIYSTLNYMIARTRYEPTMLGEFSIRHAKRNQMVMGLGISGLGLGNPEHNWYGVAINKSGGPYGFDGLDYSANPDDAPAATFYFDFTDLGMSYWPTGEQRRWHVRMQDTSADGLVASMYQARLIDTANAVADDADNTPLTVDATTTYAHSDYLYPLPSDYPVFVLNGEDWTHSQSRPAEGQPPQLDNWRKFGDLYHSTIQAYRGDDDWVEYSFAVPAGIYQVSVKVRRFKWGNNKVDVLVDGERLGSIDLCTLFEDNKDYSFVWFNLGLVATEGSPAVVRLQDSPEDVFSWWIHIAEVKLIGISSAFYGDEWRYSQSRPEPGEDPAPDNWRNMPDRFTQQAYRGDGDFVEYEFSVPPGTYEVIVNAHRYIWGNNKIDVLLDGMHLGSLDLCTFLEDNRDYGFIWFSLGTATTNGFPSLLRLQDSPSDGLSWWIRVGAVALVPVFPAQNGDQWTSCQSRPGPEDPPKLNNWRNLPDHSTIQAYRGSGDWVEYTFDVPPGTYEVMVKAHRYIWGNNKVDVSLNGQVLGAIDLCTFDEKEGNYGYVWFRMGAATTVSSPALLRLQDSPGDGYSWWIRVAEVALVPAFSIFDGDRWSHCQSRADYSQQLPRLDNWRNLPDHSTIQAYRGNDDWVEYSFNVPTGSYDVYVKAKRYIWGNRSAKVLVDGVALGKINLCTFFGDKQDYGYLWFNLGSASVSGGYPTVLRIQDDPADPFSWWMRVREVALIRSKDHKIIEPCEGDFDLDGDVDGTDLAVFVANFGRTGSQKESIYEGDFDSDGDVDGSDLAIFAADFGRTDCPMPVLVDGYF